LFGADRPTIPILLKITSSRVDHKINGIDLTEYSGAAVEQEVISGGHFVVTGIHEVPGLVGFEKKGPLGMLTLCQVKVH
jgi:hypothetical protein